MLSLTKVPPFGAHILTFFSVAFPWSGYHLRVWHRLLKGEKASCLVKQAESDLLLSSASLFSAAQEDIIE